MNKIKKLVVIIAFSFAMLMLFGDMSYAQTLNDWKSNLDTGAGSRGAGYNLDIKSPESVVSVIIKAVLSLLGIIFLILMIYGGMLWMTARGNTDQVTKAKDLIIAAIIGLIIVLISYAVSYFVIKALTGATLSF